MRFSRVADLVRLDPAKPGGPQRVVVEFRVTDFDHTTADSLAMDFQEIQDGTVVVVDLTKVNSVNSGVLGAILALSTRMRKTGGSFRLCGVNSQIMEVLKITQLVKLWQVAKDRTEALAAA